MSKKFIIYSISSFIALSAISAIPFIHKGTQDIIWLIAILFILMLVSIFSAQKVNKSLFVSQAKFNAVFFGTMFLKMFFALFLIAIYLKFSGIVNKHGVVFIVCSYFIYTCFEIQFILSKLRTNSGKS